MRTHISFAGSLGILLASLGSVFAQNPGATPSPTPPPFIPGSSWRVHDMKRPQPPIVTPAPGGFLQAPSDATVLFDGKDLSQWCDAKGEPTQWALDNGTLMVAGKGDILTRQSFGDIQLHLEFLTPVPATGTSQGRSNSGVFLMSRYEVQVLDSFANQTYPDGQAAAIYGTNPPLVNASRPPGEWQSYDIFFTAPRFTKEKTLEKPAFVTVIHNGVLVQNHTEILGLSTASLPKPYVAHGDAPIKLQHHGNPVRFRNIWVRPILPEQATTTPSNP